MDLIPWVLLGVASVSFLTVLLVVLLSIASEVDQMDASND
jgi:hypothetical protein